MDVFTVMAADGTEDQVTITVTGANDPATFGGRTTGTVTEDAAKNTVSGKLTVSDPDGKDRILLGGDGWGWEMLLYETYGSFAITAAGEWTYTLNNADAVTNALAEGERVTDVFTVAAADGTETQVTVTVIGANDPPTADAGQNRVTTYLADPITLSGTGSDPEGGTLTYAWEFVRSYNTKNVPRLDHADRPSAIFDPASSATKRTLTESTLLIVQLTVTDDQGTTATDTAEIWYLTGLVDVELTGDLSGTAYESNSVSGVRPNTVGGQAHAWLSRNQWKTHESIGIVPQSSTRGKFGTFQIYRAGQWVYVVDPTDPDTVALSGHECDQRKCSDTDVFRVRAVNGYTFRETVTIRVIGEDNPPTFSGDRTGTVTEDASANTVSGTLSVSDPDGPDTVEAQDGASGTYGTFSITAAGKWTYTLDNADAETDALTAGALVTDRFKVEADGADEHVTITVIGEDDPLTFGGDRTGTVTEDASANTVSGALHGERSGRGRYGHGARRHIRHLWGLQYHRGGALDLHAGQRRCGHRCPDGRGSCNGRLHGDSGRRNQYPDHDHRSRSARSRAIRRIFDRHGDRGRVGEHGERNAHGERPGRSRPGRAADPRGRDIREVQHHRGGEVDLQAGQRR